MNTATLSQSMTAAGTSSYGTSVTAPATCPVFMAWLAEVRNPDRKEFAAMTAAWWTGYRSSEEQEMRILFPEMYA